LVHKTNSHLTTCVGRNNSRISHFIQRNPSCGSALDDFWNDHESDRNKNGISDLDFVINSLELIIKCNEDPDDPKEFEFNIFPGENIDKNLVKAVKLEKLIPCNPSKAVINMGKSLNPKDFRIEIYFGKNDF
jgi:hypothetical protein